MKVRVKCINPWKFQSLGLGKVHDETRFCSKVFFFVTVTNTLKTYMLLKRYLYICKQLCVLINSTLNQNFHYGTVD